MQINGTTEPVGLHCAVARINRQIPAESAHIHSSIACVDLQVALLRHAHLDVQLPGVVAPAKANSPMSGNPGDKLNLVAILAGIDGQIPAQFIALILDAEFHLFRVSRGHPDAAVIGFHVHVGSSGHSEGLRNLLRANLWCRK